MSMNIFVFPHFPRTTYSKVVSFSAKTDLERKWGFLITDLWISASPRVRLSEVAAFLFPEMLWVDVTCVESDSGFQRMVWLVSAVLGFCSMLSFSEHLWNFNHGVASTLGSRQAAFGVAWFYNFGSQNIVRFSLRAVFSFWSTRYPKSGGTTALARCWRPVGIWFIFTELRS